MEDNKEKDLVVLILREIYGKLVTSVVNEPSKKEKRRRPGEMTATENNPDEEHADGNKTLDDGEDELVVVQDKVNLLSSQTREVKGNIADLNQGGQTLTLKLDVIQVTLEAITIEANHLWGRFGAVSREVGEVVRMVNVIRVKIDAVKENLKVVSADGEIVQGKIEAVEEEMAQVRNVTEKMEDVKEGTAEVRKMKEVDEGTAEVRKMENVKKGIAEVGKMGQVEIGMTEVRKIEEVRKIGQVEEGKIEEVWEGMSGVGNATVPNETSDLHVCLTVEFPDVHEKDTGFGRGIVEPESNERLGDHDGPMVDQLWKETWKGDDTNWVELGETREKRKTYTEKWESKRLAVDTKAGILGENKEDGKQGGPVEHGEMTDERKTDEGKEKWQRERTTDYTKTGKLGEMKENMKRTRETEEELDEIKEKTKRTMKTDDEIDEINDPAELTDDSDNFDMFDFLTGMEDGDANDSLGIMGDVRTIKPESPRKKTGVAKNIDEVGECDEVSTTKIFLDDCDQVDETGDALCEDGTDDWKRESVGEMKIETYRYGVFEKFIGPEELSDDCDDEIVDDYFDEKETPRVSDGLDEIRDEIVKIYVEIGEITKDIEEFKTGIKSSDRTDVQKIISKLKSGPVKKGCVCDICGKILATKKSLRVHKKRHTRPRTIRPKKPKVEHRCPICGKLCAQKQYLRIHMKTHSHVPVECEKCGQVCSTQGRYVYHMTTHGVMPKGVELNQCEVCGKVFSTPQILTRHRRLHFRPRVLKFECSYCSRRFCTQNTLNGHLAMHTGKRDFICEVCGKSFRNKAGLRNHQVSHLPEKRFHCDICHKRFSRHGNYKRHLDIHTGVRRAQCSLCGKSFRDSGILKTHMKTHSLLDESVSCDICHKRYSTKSYLKVHQRAVHQKQPSETNNTVDAIIPSKCDICSKTFSSIRKLKQHMRTHFKNFICQICGRAFSTKQCLSIHVDTHTREKNFTCDDCGRKFNQLNNLTRHMRIIHSQDSDAKTFNCHVCCKSFKCIDYLKAHIKTHNKAKGEKRRELRGVV